MARDPRKYLFDILDSCRFLIEFTSTRTLDDLRADRAFRSAVERELQIAGEALLALSKVAPEAAEAITEYKRIIRFRHVLVHGYDSLDRDIVWSIVQGKIPVLTKDVEQLLDELNGI